MHKIKLSQCGSYVTKERINSNKLNTTNYITTDNMLPNKEGVCDAEKIPTNINVNCFQENDILLSNIRPYFKKIWKAEYDGGCSADVLVFRTNNEYNADFIRYCLSQDAFFDYDMKGAKGSKMPRGDKNHILNFELYDFPLPTQTSIASVLKALDNKIALNNKINNELEQMAKTLYDYWFIQFDFPDEKGRPYKSANGKMVYNEILKREIPEGWDVKSLYDIATYINGLACQKFRPIDENSYNVIKIKELHTGFNEETEKVRKNIPSKYLVNDGDILFSWSATLEVHMWTGGTGVLNQHIFNVKSKEYPKSFCYYLLNEYVKVFKKIAETRKTTMGHITIDHLKQAYVLIPPLSLINALDNRIKPIFDSIIIHRKEQQSLANIRDFLLPLLMNGQVTVSSEH